MKTDLRKLFEFNTIASNPRLDAMIQKTTSRYATKSGRVELTEDEAEFLAAAGTPDQSSPKKKNLFDSED